MIQILQIINHMFSLGYTELDIDSTFTDVLNGDESIWDLCDFIGVELTDNQASYIEKALPKYESALRLTVLKREVA